MMDFCDQFTCAELKFQEKVARFMAAEIKPLMAAHYENATFPIPDIKMLGRLGVLGANLKYPGCPGKGDVAYGLALQELERIDSSIRSFVSVQTSLVMYPIFALGSERQKKRWLPALATGEAIGCFGLTEPESGSDPSSLKTTAVQAGKEWVISGRKKWITNGMTAHIAVIWARTDAGIRGFLIESDRKGYAAERIKMKLSLRASPTAEIILDAVHIPKNNILPQAAGLGAALRCLNEARFGIGWGVLGAADECFHEALQYTKSRMAYGRPIAGFQLVQEKLADMATEIAKARLLAIHLGRRKEQGKIIPAQVSMLKRNNVRMALTVARTARDLLGAQGITSDFATFRHMANLESVSTYEGTDHIHTLVIGKELTGLDAVH